MQIAAEVVQESDVSQHHAAASIGVSILQIVTASFRVSHVHSAAWHGAIDSSAGRQGSQVIVSAQPSRATSLAHLHQAVQQTEACTAALERRVTQSQADPQPDQVSAQDTRQRMGQQAARKQLKFITSMMPHMKAQKQARQHSTLTQHLQAFWPLTVSPNAEQQAAALALLSGGTTPQQSKSSGRSLGRMSTVKLKLQSLPPARKRAAASAQEQYWQQVAVTFLATESILTLPSAVSKQDSKQQILVTALQASPNAAYLACGSSFGELLVIAVNTGLHMIAKPQEYTAGGGAVAGDTFSQSPELSLAYQ